MKKHIFRRIVSLLLVLVLIVGMQPSGLKAAEDDQTQYAAEGVQTLATATDGTYATAAAAVAASEEDAGNTGTADTSWYDDSSTSFTISTADELAGLASLVNAGNSFSGKTVTLANDIDLGA